jgi:hypothetical protein
MALTADVVIIGGGVTGTSIAFYRVGVGAENGPSVNRPFIGGEDHADPRGRWPASSLCSPRRVVAAPPRPVDSHHALLSVKLATVERLVPRAGRGAQGCQQPLSRYQSPAVPDPVGRAFTKRELA